MKIRTYIVDDMDDQYFAMTEILTNPPFSSYIEIVSTWQGNNPYENAKRDITEKHPQLLFIDHYLNQGNSRTGLSLFKEIEEPDMFVVFFSYMKDKIIEDANKTKYAKFIPKNASIDPNSTERRLIIEKEKHLVDKEYLFELVTLARLFIEDRNQSPKLFFKTQTSLNSPSSGKYFQLNRIACFEADGNYSLMWVWYTPEAKRIFHSIKDLESSSDFEIEYYGFLRVHDRWIVNVNLIFEFDANIIKLIGLENPIPIGRTYKEKGVLTVLKDHFKVSL